VGWDVAGVDILLSSAQLVAVVELQLNLGFALTSILILLIELPLRRSSADAFGDEEEGLVRSCSSRTSVGGGRSMLNGNSWSVKGAGESVYRMGDNDEEEAKEEPLGRPSVLNSVNRGSLVSSSSGQLRTSPYSSSSTSIPASLKSTIPGGADTDSGINNLSPPRLFIQNTPTNSR